MSQAVTFSVLASLSHLSKWQNHEANQPNGGLVQNMLQGLHIPSGLGTPHSLTWGDERCSWRRERLGRSAQPAATVTQISGWMIGRLFRHFGLIHS